MAGTSPAMTRRVRIGFGGVTWMAGTIPAIRAQAFNASRGLGTGLPFFAPPQPTV